MKPHASLLLLAALLSPASHARDATTTTTSTTIERVPLDDQVVVAVPVATNRVTTLSFPGPIEAIDAAGASMDPKQPGPYLLAHTPGSAFLSVRATTLGASGNLNVRHDGRTYVFELHQDPVPVLSLILTEPPLWAIPPKPRVTPARLLSLLDRARAFSVLKDQHPEAVAEVESRRFPEAAPGIEQGGISVRLDEVLRFAKEDSLVFRITILNATDQPKLVSPDTLRVRVGNQLFHPSIADGISAVPACGEASILFAVTGSSDGSGERAELSLKNSFQIQFTPHP